MNGTILHTGDGGVSWSQQVVGTTDEFRGVVFVDSSNGWATSVHPTHYDWTEEPDNWEASIWHTSNGGQTWVKQTIPANASILNRIAFIDANNGWTATEESFERARKVVELALTLEPDAAGAHAAMGWIQMYHDWDWRGAERSLSRALELAPGNERVLYNAGALALNQGRFDRAMELFQRAEEQDPLSVASMDSLGFALYTANRLEEAEKVLRRSLDLAPQRAWVRCVLSLCLLAQGRCEEALTAAMREPDEAWRLWISAIVIRALKRQEETEENLRLVIDKYGDSMSVQIAENYSALGNADAAFNWLDRAYDNRDDGLAELKNNRQLPERSRRGVSRVSAQTERRAGRACGEHRRSPGRAYVR